ncbi:MAG: hypothetical protein NC191_01305 [Muribaculaceae bacterium]|nr:hypothetical protein [Muribaculaceae bacterium]
MQITRVDVNDKTGDVSFSNFKLNGITIEPNCREVLPLFSFLAKLTRKIQKLPDMSENRINVLKLANKSIHEEAMRFIEDIM